MIGHDISWLLFLMASVAVIVTPGQDMMLVMARSMGQGARAGVATAAGVSTGLMLHTVLATLGVGAIVRTSAWLFIAMKVVGAIYLLYLGIALLRTTRGDVVSAEKGGRSMSRLYLDGAVSNVANPKIAIFYFAFLPQFIAPGSATTTTSIFVLGAVFALITFLSRGQLGFSRAGYRPGFDKTPGGCWQSIASAG